MRSVDATLPLKMAVSVTLTRKGFRSCQEDGTTVPHSPQTIFIKSCVIETKQVCKQALTFGTMEK